MSSNMKRRPSLLRSTPPSPRTPSVTRMPRTLMRPDHAGGMKLHELHVEQFGAGAVGEREPVAGVFPTVAGDLVRAADAAGGEDDGLGLPQDEVALFAIVAEGAGDAAAIHQQAEDGAFHVHFHAGVDAVILQGADHLEAGAVADVGQAGIAMPAEVALQNAAVFGAIEERAPGFEFAHAVGRFLGVQFGHAPVVQVLAAAHGVGEMHAPVVAVVHVGQRGRHAAFGHDGVRLAEKRFADHTDLDAGGRRLRWRRAIPRRPRRLPERRRRTSGILPSRRFSSPTRCPWRRGGRRYRRSRRSRGWPTPTSCGFHSGS